MPLNSNYGAASSLRLHQQILREEDSIELTVIDMVRPRDAVLKLHYLKVLCNLGNSYSLPFRLNYDAYSQNLVNYLKFVASYILFWLNSWALRRRVTQIAPDIIHFNSLVLIDLLPWLKHIPQLKDTRFIAHVRELLAVDLDKRQIEMITQLDGLICIDHSTKARLLTVVKDQLDPQKITVIPNPFFSPSHYAGKAIPNLNIHNFIFAIVGKIAEDKGVNFVCEAFLLAGIIDAQLVIVGSGSGIYFQEFLEIVKQYPQQLIYVGEMPNLAEIGFYTLVDCVVRGDVSFRTGRTVFEGLYAGTKAIVVGNPCDINYDPHLAKFSDRVLFYPTRDQQQLVEQMRRAANGKPLKSGAVNHNFAEYRQQILDFYRIHSRKRISKPV
ncbi:MAG: hypothetical protein ACK4QL_04370 [Pseudanabaenaceae cyanobacterium]